MFHGCCGRYDLLRDGQMFHGGRAGTVLAVRKRLAIDCFGIKEREPIK